MAGFDWKSIVGTVAPALATALGGPLAGMATGAIAKAFGLGEGVSEQDVMAAVSGATPEQMLALKQAEQSFTAQMRELDVDLVRIAASDRDSARKREMATGDVWTPRLLGVLVLLFALGLEGTVLFLGYPKDIPGEVVGRVLGTLDTAAVMVLSYYFGSSSGAEAGRAQGVAR